MRPHQPVAPAVPSPVALPSAKPPGVPLAFSAWHHLQEAGGVLREAVEAGRLQHALAVDHHRARGAQRPGRSTSCRPAAGRPARRIPAAVLLAEIARPGRSRRAASRGTGCASSLVDRMMSGTGAGVGGHRGLGPHVLPAFVVDAHLDAGLGGELLAVLHVQRRCRPARSGSSAARAAWRPFRACSCMRLRMRRRARTRRRRCRSVAAAATPAEPSRNLRR